MKKGIIAALFAAAIAVVGCYNDDELQKKVNDLDKRVTTLEEQVKELNEKTVPGLQATVAAIQDGVFVSKVSKNDEGVTITFSDGTTAFIKNGDKGDPGNTPVIAVKEVDGVFYWTINGEILKDADGKPVTVYATLPQFRINNGKWEVSYDEGATWTIVDVMGETETLPISIQDDADTVTFYIGDQSYVIQKEHAFFISFNISDRKNIGVPEGEEFMYEYTINGLQADDELEVDILNVTAGWEARVVSLPTAENPGYIAVKNVENKDGKVFVYAANGRGKTDIKSLVFEGGVLTAEMDVKTVGPQGGNVILTVVTNMDYELYVAKNQSWLTVAPETKATHTDVITLVAAANETAGFRSAEVDVILQNGDTEAFVVLQTPSEDEITDLSTVSGLADETEVTLFNVAVLASSENSAIIGDGTTNLYCTIEGGLPVGKSVNVTGTKTSDDDDNVIFVVSSYEVAAEETEITAGEPTYYGVSSYYAPMYTTVTGTPSATNSGYTLEALEGQIINIDMPLESAGVAEVSGKLATIYGFVALVSEDEEENEVYTFVATEAKEVVLAENAGWELSYKNDPENDATYPEAITNTVTGSDVPYLISVYSKEKYEELGQTKAILMLSDDLQYYYWYYGLLYGYTPAQLNAILLNTDTYTETFKNFAYGEYVAVAAGVNEDGTVTGDYKIYEFEKVDPSIPAEYSDFIGNWIINGNTVAITEKVNGESYNIDGLASTVTSDAKIIEGIYDSEAKNMVIMEQKIGDRNISSYGNCSVHLMAIYNDGSSNYPGWPTNADEPGSAMIFKLQQDGSVIVSGGQVFDKYDEEYYDVVGYRFRWIIDEGDYAGKGNWDGAQVNLPLSIQKAAEASEAYTAWLGSYTVNTVDKTGEEVSYNVTLAQGVPNQTILLNGLGINGLPFEWDSEADKLVMKFGVFSSNSSYDFYASGITNDSYVCTGDDDDKITELINENGTITAKSVVYSISDERPEVYAAYWGVLGKNLSTSKWATFTDCSYIYNNATFTKSAGTTAVKSVSNPTADKSFRFEPNFKDAKVGESVKRISTKKENAARETNLGKSAIIKR